MKKYVSAIIALFILVVGAMWMMTGTIVHGGRGDQDGQTIATREATREKRRVQSEGNQGVR